MLAGNARRVQEILNCLARNCDDVEAAILFSPQGLVMVSTLVTGPEEEQIAATTAGISAMIEHLRNSLEWDPYLMMMISWPVGNLILKELDGEAILAVLTRNNVSWSRVVASCNWVLASIFDLGSHAGQSAATPVCA